MKLIINFLWRSIQRMLKNALHVYSFCKFRSVYNILNKHLTLFIANSCAVGNSHRSPIQNPAYRLADGSSLHIQAC